MTFIEACRKRGARTISAGTFPVLAEGYPQAVREVLDVCDYFFMNGREARAVFGSLEAAKVAPGNVLFVTRGNEGATVVQGDFQTAVPAIPAREVDPTGAGDTFCGATLAFLLAHEHPIMAAQRAVALAAEMIAYVGPTALMVGDPPPLPPVDVRVRVNSDQVDSIAGKIATFAEPLPFPFAGPGYPDVGHPDALDYFFAATLQQFSFWSTRDGRYDQPMIAPIGGVELKGSDYLWAAYTRHLERYPDFCTPERQANFSREEMLELFRSDDGRDPMPALDLHLDQARSYGRDMLALGYTPWLLLHEALAAPETLQHFINQLSRIGGYKEDPLAKKSNLLALILRDRPEAFLPLSEDDVIRPIIDYHLMRSTLRTGLVDVRETALREKLANRQLLSPEEEWAVRYPAYHAIEALIAQSGKSSGDIDWFFFNARRRCPEMTEPRCTECPIDDVCAQRKELFQPVIRTVFY
jgi:hypothetical protein